MKVIWLHNKTQKKYFIIGFGIDEASLQPFVIYQEENSDATWLRSCEKFFDGRFIQQLSGANDNDKSHSL